MPMRMLPEYLRCIDRIHLVLFILGSDIVQQFSTLLVFVVLTLESYFICIADFPELFYINFLEIFIGM